jgi:hypothetical protein
MSIKKLLRLDPTGNLKLIGFIVSAWTLNLFMNRDAICPIIPILCCGFYYGIKIYGVLSIRIDHKKLYLQSTSLVTTTYEAQSN